MVVVEQELDGSLVVARVLAFEVEQIEVKFSGGNKTFGRDTTDQDLGPSTILAA